jgi:hypothetical protein
MIITIKGFVLTALACALGAFVGLVAFAATMVVIELFN